MFAPTRLTAKNYLNPLSVSVQTIVTKAPLTLPSVMLDGAASRFADRVSTTLIRGHGRSSPCGSQFRAMDFTWMVVSASAAPDGSLPGGVVVGDGFQPTPLDLSSPAVTAVKSPDPRIVRIPPGVLVAGNRYVLRMTGFIRDEPLVRNSVDVTVTVVPSQLVAAIAGGARSGVAAVRQRVCCRLCGLCGVHSSHARGVVYTRATRSRLTAPVVTTPTTPLACSRSRGHASPALCQAPAPGSRWLRTGKGFPVWAPLVRA